MLWPDFYWDLQIQSDSHKMSTQFGLATHQRKRFNYHLRLSATEVNWSGVNFGVSWDFFFSLVAGFKMMANCYFCICSQAAACMLFD